MSHKSWALGSGSSHTICHLPSDGSLRSRGPHIITYVLLPLQAFGRLLQQLNATLEDVRSNKTLLTQVLGLHAVPGAAVLSYQLQPRQTVNTLAGLPLTVWSW